MQASRRTVFEFRLYVAGGTENSAAALVNLTNLCRAHLPDIHRIEVVDVFRNPKRALADRIFMTPALVKVGPLPVCTIVGTLSCTELVLQTLGLEPVPT